MADMIQHRYGWTDEYLFGELPVERVLSIFDTLKETLPREKREEMKMQAMGAFLQGAGGDMDYESYLIHLGLHEALEAEKDITAAEAIEKGRNILKMLGN